MSDRLALGLARDGADVVDEEHVAPRRTRRARSGSGWEEQHAPPAAEEGEAADDAEPEDAEQENRRRGVAGEPVARPGERRGTAAPAAGRGERPGTQDGTRPAVSAAVAARRAVEIVVEFTGREAETVVAIDRRDGDWYVDVEVVETHRIPDTTDVLAIYEVRLDPGGHLLSYRRTRRYARGQLDRESR
jgi:hypothetical protein